MEHYNLDEDEVVLYKGDVVFKEKTQSTQIVLTNKNLVFIDIVKKYLHTTKSKRKYIP